MKELFGLYAVFFKLGLFLFGGGYSMLPMLEREIVQKRGWATQEEILNYFAIGQCTPGIIAVNISTFVGASRKRTLGAVFATAGIVTPSIIIITIIASLADNISQYQIVKNALAGIRVGAGALIFSSMLHLIKSNVKSVLQFLLYLVAFIAVAVFGLSPVWVVVGCSLFGLAWGRRKTA